MKSLMFMASSPWSLGNFIVDTPIKRSKLHSRFITKKDWIHCFSKLYWNVHLKNRKYQIQVKGTFQIKGEGYHFIDVLEPIIEVLFKLKVRGTILMIYWNPFLRPRRLQKISLMQGYVKFVCPQTSLMLRGKKSVDLGKFIPMYFSWLVTYYIDLETLIWYVYWMVSILTCNFLYWLRDTL